jgi:mannan endo-1,4-beta-mannosidase
MIKKFLVLAALGVSAWAQAQQAPLELKPRSDWPIIQRSGDQLVEGTKPFRFLGMCSSTLNMTKEQILPDWSNRWPDEFEIRSVLDGMSRVGARATRVGIGFSIATPKDPTAKNHVTARRTYNEDAFKALDRAIALAHEYDIRIIFPLIASQSFTNTRGADEFAALSGKPQGTFWVDADVKADFKHLIDYVLNRRNTVNGLLYKDDPAILAWQLGNEFSSYYGDRKLDPAVYRPQILAWSSEMAAYLKQQDPKHLVMEAGGADAHAILADPNIDIMSTHLYEYWNRLGGQDFDLAPIAKREREEYKGKKPLIVDELGLASHDNLKNLLTTIRTEGIVGGLLWGTRGHRSQGGWYYHNEGGTPVNSYHVPGFAAGHAYEETRTLDLLRSQAYAIRDQAVPKPSKPTGVPALLPLKEGFTWRGTMGANYYVIERRVKGKSWDTVATGLHDSVVADVKAMEANTVTAPAVLWFDEYAVAGETYQYRIKGVNVAGDTPWSDAITVVK